jgi:plastocyanin
VTPSNTVGHAFASLTLAAGVAIGGARGEARPDAGAARQQGADTTVVVRAAGTALEFIPDRITLKQGTRVRVRFVNSGDLPHNIVFARRENDLEELSIAAVSADATGYVPLEMKDRMLAWSGLAKPTETVELAFTVPAAGEYWFVCLYPGHAANMLGTLRALR